LPSKPIRSGAPREIEKVTEVELILSLCKEKNLGIDESSENELIGRFRETDGDHRYLTVNAVQRDTIYQPLSFGELI
jgi:hypothetical protein